MFKNVAPAAPADALAALERAIIGQRYDDAESCKKYVDLLRSLAYDAALFERAMKLLIIVVTREEVAPQAHETQVLASLFHLVLSGTHATIEQRIAVVESLLISPNGRQHAIGVLALKAILKTQHFSAFSNFDFGARSRDFGYWPRSREEVQHWFSTALSLVETLACAGGPAACQTKAILAEKVRGLWLYAASDDEIARVCMTIGKQGFWPEGWLAVRQTLRLCGMGLEPDRLAKLVAIEKALRPADLTQKVRAIVFTSRVQYIDLDEFEDHTTEDVATRMARTEVLARELGKDVANDEAVFAQLLPELMKSDGSLLWFFGQGLVDGAGDRAGTWQRLITALGTTEAAERRLQVLRGYLWELRATDDALATKLLDEAVEHKILATSYPFLQVAVALDAQDVARLKRSLVLEKSPAINYEHLAFGGAVNAVPAPDLCEILLGIAALPSGNDIAVEVLHMRLHSDKNRKHDLAPELIDVGRELMRKIVFTKKNDREDYRLGEICAACLTGAKGAAVVTQICRRLKNAVAKYQTSAYNHDDLLVGLFTAQPAAALEGLCGGDQKALELGMKVLKDASIRKDPVAVVAEEEVLRWCDVKPRTRYPAIANVINISHHAGENTPPRWTSLALRLLETAPDPNAILRSFTSRFMPAEGWNGSLSAILESNAALLDQLEAYPALKETIAVLKIEVLKWIEQERSRENLWNRERDERFE